MAVWGSWGNSGQHRPALLHISVSLYSLPFSSSHLPFCLYVPKNLFPDPCSRLYCQKDKDEGSLNVFAWCPVHPSLAEHHCLHGHLSIYMSGRGATCKKELYLSHLYSQPKDGSSKSMDPWMSEWMNWPFNTPRILGLKLTCSGNVYTIIPHQCLVCVHTLHASVDFITHICAQEQNHKRELGE